ncbi:hydrogenase accessory protein [Actibacterium lipolyticum]|uniref:Hydrogenase-1 operon protein HyaE n=1 Tax=Actibacterium lipolyticum TaxID=1524263 RepID=A0A238JJ41_9RHOB|nr:hydrogenase accessory protein [Actibacterium lipolyticum]SMX30679.1 hydrogenase-1 operon protein HyaE [Actibacterium lipolyticum]
MSYLIERLSSEMGWPSLGNASDIAEFINRPGVHVLFVPGDAKRNLETNDVAVILPELKMTFQGQFDCAVVQDSAEAALRESAGVWKTPSLIFYREGSQIGAIPKVRDWDEYMARIMQILATPAVA